MSELDKFAEVENSVYSLITGSQEMDISLEDISGSLGIEPDKLKPVLISMLREGRIVDDDGVDMIAERGIETDTDDRKQNKKEFDELDDEEILIEHNKTSYKEVAEKYGVTTSSVKTRISRITSAYSCDHCHKPYSSQQSKEIHEEICEKNPNGSKDKKRTTKEGIKKKVKEAKDMDEDEDEYEVTIKGDGMSFEATIDKETASALISHVVNPEEE